MIRLRHFNRVDVLALPRIVKRFIAVSIDVTLCVLTTWLAFCLRIDEFVRINNNLVLAISLSIAIALPVFASAGMYLAIFRYSAGRTITAIARAITSYGLIYMTILMVVGIDGVPRSVGLIQPLLLFFGIAASRILARFWLGEIHQVASSKDLLPRVVIYGAGQAGRQLADALGSGFEMQVIGYFDDDERLHGHMLNGVPVFDPIDLPDLIASRGLTHILLAMPSVSRARRNEILKYVSLHQVVVRTIPSMADLADGRVTFSDIKDLEIEDLLRRDSIPPNHILLSKNIFRKTVLVTGAGGSIGAELCRQILKFQPKKLLLVEINEYALYTIQSELEAHHNALEYKLYDLIVPLLASVQDEERIRDILGTWQPDTVYHAAAYKHVHLVEHNLAEGVKNNVIGTLVMAKLAIEKSVSDFVLISTDKAVRPTNAMGASKRLAELCLQALFAEEMRKTVATGRVGKSYNPSIQSSKTRLSMVRFGNVLDSSGSVIPRFRKQIHDGGPITLTHPEVTRYFMTIREAAQLVIQAGAMAKGGDVFVLDMGEPVRIADLARSMIELSGLTVRDDNNPEGDIEIVVTGLRPGEKLYEELLLGIDPQPTQHPKIERALDEHISWSELEVHLDALKLALGHDNVERILLLLQKLVPEYKPFGNIVDWVYREQSRSSSGADALDYTNDPMSSSPCD